MLIATVMCATQGFAQYEQFPDVPGNHWVYVTLQKLKQAGLIKREVILFRGGRPYDRMEVAMLTMDACEEVLYVLDRAEHEGNSATERASPVFAAKKEIGDLTNMVAFFSKELGKRHIDFAKLRTDMKLVPQRLDVIIRNWG